LTFFQLFGILENSVLYKALRFNFTVPCSAVKKTSTASAALRAGTALAAPAEAKGMSRKIKEGKIIKTKIFFSKNR
jgi:hypothetical protein